MPSMISPHTPLGAELSRHQLFKERLLQAYPDEDLEELADTLEGLTSLNEMLAAVIRSALFDEALRDGLKQHIAAMKERLARFEQRATRKRQLALEAMAQAGLKKLQQPDFTASRRMGQPGLLVQNEAEVPASYWIPQPPKLDRQALLDDLKAGASIAGVVLGERTPSLTVRTR